MRKGNRQRTRRKQTYKITENNIARIKSQEIGTTYKNYPTLCEELELTIYRGTQKTAQLKELQRYCKLEKEGISFILKEVYEVPLSSSRGRRIDFLSYCVEQQYDKSIGVYKVVNYETKEIYVGSTIKGFRERFNNHNKETNHLRTFDMLQNGAVFEVIEAMADNSSEEEVREREEYWIDYYKKNGEWDCINTRKKTTKKAMSKIKTEEEPNVLIYIKVKDKDLEKLLEGINALDIDKPKITVRNKEYKFIKNY